MNIEQLTIENFKCFKSEKTFDFSRLTILTGANSSGKSSVMYAVLMVIQTEDFPSFLSPNGNFVRLGDFREIVNQHDSNRVLQIGITYKSQLFKTFWIKDEVSQLPKILKIQAVDNDKLDALKETKRVSLKNATSSLYHKTNYISAFRQTPQRTYYEQNKANYKVGTEGEEYIDQIVEWDKRSNGKIKELVNIMAKLDLIEEIKINRFGGGRFEVIVKPVNSNLLTSLANVGFGVSQFLPIIVADLQLPNDSTLFLAEPEIHLHPSVQSKFGEYIVNQINNSDKNYVIETHSEYFLNRIRLAIVKGELKKEDIKVYFLENTKDDTEVYDIQFTTTGVINNAPKNFFETYFADSMAITLNAFAE